MVTWLTFVVPLCFRLQLGTEEAVVRDDFENFIQVICTACTRKLRKPGTLDFREIPDCKGSGKSYNFSWPSPKSLLRWSNSGMFQQKSSSPGAITCCHLFLNTDIFSQFWCSILLGSFQTSSWDSAQVSILQTCFKSEFCSDVAAIRFDNEGTKPHWFWGVLHQNGIPT